jgi:transcription antitermination factor NusG
MNDSAAWHPKAGDLVRIRAGRLVNMTAEIGSVDIERSMASVWFLTICFEPEPFDLALSDLEPLRP